MEAMPASGRRRVAGTTIALACIAALCASAASGCASVTVDAGNQQVTTRGLLGTRVIATALQPIAIHSRGLGVFATPRSFAVGWQNEKTLYLSPDPDDCRIVLINAAADDVRALVRILEEGGLAPSAICTDTKEKVP